MKLSVRKPKQPKNQQSQKAKEPAEPQSQRTGRATEPENRQSHRAREPAEPKSQRTCRATEPENRQSQSAREPAEPKRQRTGRAKAPKSQRTSRAKIYMCVHVVTGKGDSTCGNGVLDNDEECDDKNVVTLDGCSSCAIDAFYMCHTSWRHPDTPNRRGFMVCLLPLVFTISLTHM